MGIIVWLIVGLIAGALSRWLVPGPDPMGVGGTLVLGLAGSLIGGFLGNLVFHQNIDIEAAGLVGSVIGGVIALFGWRAYNNRKALV